MTTQSPKDRSTEGGHRKGTRLAWRAVLGVILVFGTMLLGILASRAGPQTTAVQAELEAELGRIAPLPSAQPVGHHSIAREDLLAGGDVLVDSNYITSLDFDHIRSHYDQEFDRNGWQPAGEEKITDWGADLGGRAVYYHKGAYNATLTYAGEQADSEQYGWTYTLGFTWESKPDRNREPQGAGTVLPSGVSFGVAAIGVALWSVVQGRIISRHGLGYFRMRNFKDIYWNELPTFDRWLLGIGTGCLVIFIVLFFLF